MCVKFKHIFRILAKPSVYFVKCYPVKDQAGIENVSQDLYATLSDNGQIIKKGNSTRVKFRVPDPTYNPYLTFSMILTAGLEGIEKKYELVDPIEENVFEMSSEQRKQRGISSLPANLSDAISLTEHSQLVRKALGDHVFASSIKNKRIERDQYRIQVTEYELKK